ncbi:MAG: hypothetical protein KF729_23400, partial [Sandaracinaceae bacterium]|nr:hypothetical protein [Sandaracinaceae bacterium]
TTPVASRGLAPPFASDLIADTPAPRAATPAFEAEPLAVSAARALADVDPPRGLAPGPLAVAPHPRRFVAQSPDWREPGRGGPPPESSRRLARPASRPDARSPASASSPGLSRHSPAPRTPTPFGAPVATQVKGSLVLCAVEHLAGLGPRALDRVFERLGGTISERVAAVKMPMAWVGLEDYVALLRASERELGTGDGSLAIDVGVTTAERELSTTHRLFMRTSTPAMALERVPQIFRSYHSSGRVVVDRAPTGGHRLETSEIEPDALAHAMMWSGFFKRMLELAGGRDVRASVVTCRERGDDRTVTVVRWR